MAAKMTSSFVTLRLFLFLNLCLTFSGCCRKDLPESPSFHFYDLGIASRMISIDIESADGRQRIPGLLKAHQFAAEGLEGHVGLDRDRLVFDVRNETGSLLAIDWANTVYVDEGGVSHRLYLRGPSMPPTWPIAATEPRASVEPGKRLYAELFPLEKTYLVRGGCRDSLIYREPIVPWIYRGHSQATVVEKAEALKREKRQIALIVPVSRGTTAETWKFTYELYDRVRG